MSFLNKLTASLPFGKKEEQPEYFFAVNIGVEKLTASLWTIEGRELKILDIASQSYSSNDEIATVTDKLLDQVLGLKEIEPAKILFGVPSSWILDDNLKDEYLKILRHLVKELELTPMAYVSTSNALIHFLEKQEGVPTTAILVGFGTKHLMVMVARAGKLDGTKVVVRGENSGSDIEKALLAFTDVETLPSKILVYGDQTAGLKSQLMSFSWMSKLSFLHFPKIEALGQNLEIKSVCLAGGSEINSNVLYADQPIKKRAERLDNLEEENPKELDQFDKPKDQIIDESVGTDSEISDRRGLSSDENEQASESSQSVEALPDKEVEAEEEVSSMPKKRPAETPISGGDNFGFVVGDVAEEDQKSKVKDQNDLEEDKLGITGESMEQELMIPEEDSVAVEDLERSITPPQPHKEERRKKLDFKKFIPKNSAVLIILFGIIGVVGLTVGAFLFLVKADVKIFVEPKILERDAQVVADPNQKVVNEDSKIIPGQIVNTEISGSAKDTATGKRQIGDPAKGTVVIRNKTDEAITLSKGTALSGNNQKFTLDVSVTIASRSADDGTWGKANGTVTAAGIGADGNISSGTDITVSGHSADKIVAKSEGNFSGGTSKDVTVVSAEDQQRLLAKLSSELRQQAQQKLQEKYPDKKILGEALSESIAKKSYNKGINDQASEFSLNMTLNYKGTAFNDADLKTIVSKLVTTQVPDGFQLNLSDTETQADVSKLEKDGKLIFLAKFKAKLMPKVDTDRILSQIKFKDPIQAMDIIKNMENILGSEINISPKLPSILQRLPILSNNIKIEVGLK